MTLTPAQAQLLRDVAAAIIESGYAVPARPPYRSRRQQIAAIAEDARLNSLGAAKAALIEDVMRGCEVERGNARQMICKARKMRSEIESGDR